MIGWLKKRVSPYGRPVVVRVVLWGSIGLCIGLWAYLLYQTYHFEKAGELFKEYYTIENKLDSLKTVTADSSCAAAFERACRGVHNGWVAMAIWLEIVEQQGRDKNITVNYRFDTLEAIAGGNSSIKSIPVHFKITPDNRFCAVGKWLESVCGDTAVAVRLDRVEYIGGTKGLVDVYIDLITWIRL